MATAKPTQPPVFDAGTTWKVLDAELRKDDGTGYQVFRDSSLPRWKRWIGGEDEYDGKGLRDVVLTNAIYLDNVEQDLIAHKQADSSRHNAINQRLAALEASQAQPSPFPGVSSSPGASRTDSETDT